MKICIAQTKPVKGDIEKNTLNHIKLIEVAADEKVDLIVFPELSLTGYEPALANELATNANDYRLKVFQTLSNAHQMTIGVGIPTPGKTGIQISLIFFQPFQLPITYSKQFLHSDEFPFFVKGEKQLYLNIKKYKIAPAICYESMLTEHVENAVENGAKIYFASVAKTAAGVEKGFHHYSEIAKKCGITLAMTNYVGPSDNFESAGKSAIWNQNGELMGQLDGSNEGILTFNLESNLVQIKYC